MITPNPLLPLVAAMLGAFSAAAGAQAYTSVTTDQGFVESFSGAPLALPSMGGVASVSANGLDLHVSDSTHWVGGPYAAAYSAHTFGVAGAAGTYETLSFTVAVDSHYGNDLAANFTASHGFSVELTGNAAPVVGASGGLVEVNCLGCGGHLGGGTLSGSVGPTGEWGHDFSYTYTFSTQVERGWNQAGRLGLNAYLGVGSTWADLTINLLSITDSQGQALSWGTDGFLQAVPEPSTGAMVLAGMGALGFALRRRRG